MPRIPMLDKFMDYVEVGKELADLHVNYERCIDPAEIGLIIDAVKPDYTVSKMKFKKQGKSVCRDTIIYNEYITISNIPERAYEYVINGKSAIYDRILEMCTPMYVGGTSKREAIASMKMEKAKTLLNTKNDRVYCG